MNILFVSSEAFPLIKTGGLADVSGSLPQALGSEGLDVRILLPAYSGTVERLQHAHRIDSICFQHPLLQDAQLIEGVLPETSQTVLLLDIPSLYQRAGGPYVDEQGRDWPDNPLRFACLSWAACEIAMDQVGLQWPVDIVHSNDWQTGLIPAYLSLETSRPATIFTVHNQAYQGVFDRAAFDSLHLPHEWWRSELLEFYGNFSFLKAGLVFADKITTVSPTYAEELLTAEFGCGLEGVFAQRVEDLSGILNGVDGKTWNPETDPYLHKRYQSSSIGIGKRANKAALQKYLGLPVSAKTPLVGLVGRLAHQKGIDFVIELINHYADADIQWVIVGTGEEHYEQALLALAEQYPERISVHIDFNEELSHRIESAADMFLMPSRFEPCGLNQMYSLLYGTVPVVRKTGGLADTVFDPVVDPKKANGFVFVQAEADAFKEAFARALAMYKQPRKWAALRKRGFNENFTWENSARRYLQVYRSALAGLKR